GAMEVERPLAADRQRLQVVDARGEADDVEQLLAPLLVVGGGVADYEDVLREPDRRARLADTRAVDREQRRDVQVPERPVREPLCAPERERVPAELGDDRAAVEHEQLL